MAEISMLILVVDLDCHKCYHKIRKILCQLQDNERIRTISFDTKSKTITIVGPFDPHRLACKLCSKGGKVVRDVHIVDTNGVGGGGKPPPENMPDGGPPAPAPVKNGKNKNKEKAPPPPPPPPAERPPSPPPPEPAPGPPPEQMMPPPSPVHHPRPPDPGMSAMVPQPHYVEEKPPRAELEPPMSPPPKEMPPMKPMDMPTPQPQHHHPPPPPVKERPPPLMMPACPGRPLEQPVPEFVIPTVEIPSWPAPVVGPCGCPCCAPCYQGYYDSCRCSCCGRVYGTTVRPLPPPCGAYRGCRTFSDDDPSAACSVM